jgi:hypothetical protein
VYNCWSAVRTIAVGATRYLLVVTWSTETIDAGASDGVGFSP